MKTFKSIKMLSVVVTVFFLLGGIGFGDDWNKADSTYKDAGTGANDMRNTGQPYYGQYTSNANFPTDYGVIYPFENYPGSFGDGQRYITQMLFSHPSNNIYIRNSGGNGTSWSNWTRILTSDNANTSKMEIATDHGTSELGLLTLRNTVGALGYAGIKFASNPTANRSKAAIAFKETSNGVGHHIGDLIFALNNNEGDAGEVTGADERMRITSGGLVGIGTTSPAGKLHTAIGDSGATPFTANGTPVAVFESAGTNTIQLLTGAGDSHHRIWFGDNGGAIDGGIMYNHKTPISDDTMQFRVGNEARMTIQGNGNVGIGDYEARSFSSGYTPKLQVSGTSTDGGIGLTTWNTSKYNSPTLTIARSASGTPGNYSAVQNDFYLGAIHWIGADGTDFQTIGAAITAEANGAWSENNGPTDLIFSINTGAPSPAEVMRINKDRELVVDGKIKTKEVEVVTDVWADIVFDDNYQLPPLTTVESFIKENKHLPEIPSEKQIKEEGLKIADMMSLQMKKIEELTLYMIEMNKKYSDVQKENEQLKARLDTLEKVN